MTKYINKGKQRSKQSVQPQKCLSILLPMASFSRGQLPARQTKVVDESQRPLKTGSPGCGSLRNDGTSSKPYCKGRDVAEDSQGSI